jgi:adenylate cyclase
MLGGSNHAVDGPPQALSQPSAAEARDRFLQVRPTFFDQWDREVAKRNYGPQDGALLAEGARKAGFPISDRTAAEVAVPSTSP